MKALRILGLLMIYVPAAFVAISLVWVESLKDGPVNITPVMLKQMFTEFTSIEQEWVSLEKISEPAIRAVIAAEDSQFMRHNGFNPQEIAKMKLLYVRDGSPLRGCSTISQQVAKNCFTLGGRNWFRKGIEGYYTTLIEWFWGKRRILEVYLNVARTGRLLYGIETASLQNFGHSARFMTIGEATVFAAALPNPVSRPPLLVYKHMYLLRAAIAARAPLVDIPKRRS